MGCDGGTIPKRHELVKTAKRPEQKDKDMDRRAKWSTCCISQQALTEPIVTCEMGKLYRWHVVFSFFKLMFRVRESLIEIRKIY